MLLLRRRPPEILWSGATHEATSLRRTLAGKENPIMLPDKEVATPFASVANDPVFISIEMSRSKWVVGAHVPTADKVSIP